MTKLEELVIIKKRIPEQQAYIEELKERQQLNGVVLETLPSFHPIKVKRDRLQELLLSAEGVLKNLQERKSVLTYELMSFWATEEVKDVIYGKTDNN
jgi:hypothetical protein